MDKEQAYSTLVQCRKACRECRDLKNPACVEDGNFDNDQIGPWSRWQGNLNAEVLIVGQDWGGEKYFRDREGKDKDENPTNKNLMALLQSIGLEIEPPSSLSGAHGRVFLTNAILCLKAGDLQAPVQGQWFANCGPRFLKPLIELIEPRVVIGLGERAYRSLCKLYLLRPCTFRNAVRSVDGFPLTEKTLLFPVYHCGTRVTRLVSDLDRQKQHWARIKRVLR